MAKKNPWMDSLPTHAMFFDLRVRRDDEEKNESIRKLRVSPEKALRRFVKKENYRESMKTFCKKFMGISGKTLFT